MPGTRCTSSARAKLAYPTGCTACTSASTSTVVGSVTSMTSVAGRRLVDARVEDDLGADDVVAGGEDLPADRDPVPAHGADADLVPAGLVEPDGGADAQRGRGAGHLAQPAVPLGHVGGGEHGAVGVEQLAQRADVALGRGAAAGQVERGRQQAGDGAGVHVDLDLAERLADRVLGGGQRGPAGRNAEPPPCTNGWTAFGPSSAIRVTSSGATGSACSSSRSTTIERETSSRSTPRTSTSATRSRLAPGRRDAVERTDALRQPQQAEDLVVQQRLADVARRGPRRAGRRPRGRPVRASAGRGRPRRRRRRTWWPPSR